jgi:hypothetical protein
MHSHRRPYDGVGLGIPIVARHEPRYNFRLDASHLICAGDIPKLQLQLHPQITQISPIDSCQARHRHQLTSTLTDQTIGKQEPMNLRNLRNLRTRFLRGGIGLETTP